MTLPRHVGGRRALFQVQQVTLSGDTRTVRRHASASGITGAYGLDDPSTSLVAETTSRTWDIGLHMLTAVSKQRREGWLGRCRESPNVPRKCRRGRGPRLPPTGSASTAWRASVRPPWAPIHSDLHPHPYGDRIAVSEMHWDGSARRRNVDSVTSRVGYR